MLNKIIISCIFLIVPFVLFGQINNTDKGAATIYTRGVPTGAVRIKYDSEWAIDINTSKIYRYNRTTNSWGEAGSFVGYLASSSAPTGAPKYGGPEFIINSDKELYWYNAGVWHCINCSSSLTAGTGIDITGTVITNTAPDQTVTITDGGIVTVGGAYPNFTITATEVDGDPINELQFIDSLYMSNDTLFISLDRDSMPSKAIKLTGLNDGNGIYGGSDTIPDLVYAFSDSSKTFALGQFPSFPNVSTNGTTQGFYYNPDNSVKLLNGDNTSGWRNEFSLEPNIARVRTLTIDNLNATTQFQRALTDDSWYVLQGTIDNDIYGDIQIVTKLDNDEELINLSQSGRGDTLGVSMYLGKGDPNSAYYNDVNRAWGVKTDLTANEEFHWIKIHLPGNNDTVSNTIKLYEKYYFPNEQPSVILSDTSIIGWIGDGTNANPVFLPYNSGGSSLDTSGYNLDFYIQSDSLYIEDGQSILGVDLSPYLADLDEQELGIDSVSVADNKERFEIFISNGNSIFFEVMEYVETEGSIIEGGGIPGDPIQLSEGSNNGEVLMWNQDLSIWEIVLIATTDEIDGTGFATDPLKIAQQGATDTQVLAWDDDSQTWQPKDDLDTDDQTLTLDSSAVTGGQNFILTIEDGNNVSFFIPDPSAGAQTLSIDSTDLVGIERYEISISGGNSIFLDDDDNQTVDTFEIVSNILRLSIEEDGQPFKSVDLSPYLDDEDSQTLTIDSSIVGSIERFELSISNGNTIYFDVSTAGVTDLSFSGASSPFTLNSSTGTDVTFTQGSGITLSGSATNLTIAAVDQSATNEIQRLDTFEIVSNILRASLLNDGVPFSSVSLSSYLDNTDEQELTLDSTIVGSLERFELTIDNGNTVYFDVPQNTDAQTLSVDSTTISTGERYEVSISGGNTIYLDDDDQQKIDTFEIVSNVLRLSLQRDNEPFKTVNLSSYLDNTDAQNLTIEGSGPTYDIAISGGSDVTIQGGGIITLSESPANTLIITGTEVDGSTTNEIQQIDTFFIVGAVISASLSLDGVPAKTLDITESTQDIIGGMVTGNTETGITVTYEDSDGTLDFVVNDVSATNEIQRLDTFEIVGNVLRASLLNDAVPFSSVDLSAYLDNTDTQDLSIDSVVVGSKERFTINLTNSPSISFDVETNAGTVTSVAATAPAAGFTISGSPITSSGTFVFTLSDDLAGLEAMSGTGIVVRTASNTYTQRTLQEGVGIDITNGSGVSADPTINADTTLLATLNDINIQAPRIAYGVGNNMIGGSGNFTFETNTIRLNTTSGNDTLLNFLRSGTSPFSIYQFTDPYNGSTVAYRMGGLNGRRIFLEGFGIYMEAPFYQEETAGIGFIGSTGDLRLHTNGDYYTATLAGDNQTTNRNISFYFTSGGSSTGKGNPVIFQQVHSNNDTLCNSFEFLARNTAVGGITHPDSNLFRIGNWDRGTAVNILHNLNVGIQTRTPTRDLDVNGEARVRDLVTTNPTFLVGTDNDGVLSRVTLGDNLTFDGTTLDAATGGTDTNIYNDDGNVQNGGTIVDVSNDDPIIFDLNNVTTETNRILRFEIAHTDDVTTTNILKAVTPSDSITLRSYDSGMYLDYTGTTNFGEGLVISSNTIMDLRADSFLIATIPTKTVLHFLTGMYNNTFTKIEGTANGQVLVWDETNGYWEIGSAGASDELVLTAAPSSDHTASGIKITLVANENQAFGDACYINSDGEAQLGDADAIATASCIVICLETVTTGNSAEYLLQGIARDDTWAWTVGGLIYLSTTGTTGNTLTQTAPSGTNDVVQILGVATHADRIYFTSNLMQIELN